jgi:hypothetical protein
LSRNRVSLTPKQSKKRDGTALWTTLVQERFEKLSCARNFLDSPHFPPITLTARTLLCARATTYAVLSNPFSNALISVYPVPHFFPSLSTILTQLSRPVELHVKFLLEPPTLLYPSSAQRSGSPGNELLLKGLVSK